jgi:hypothetical protein
MKTNKPQKTNKHPGQITLTNKFEVMRQAEPKGNNQHERNVPTQPLTFGPGITNMQRLTPAI